MIILGWGKKAKQLAFIGIEKCENCKNWCRFDLYKMSRRITLYFVPVAKWGKTYYAVCSTCEAGFEISEPQAQELLKKSVHLPDASETERLWLNLMGVEQWAREAGRKEFGASGAEVRQVLRDQFDINQYAEQWRGRYTDDEIAYALPLFRKYLEDNDLPE